MYPAIILHGGAGSWKVDRKRIEIALNEIKVALDKGWFILERGGTAVESVVEALKHMEDTGLFNAGLGSCLNIMGYREMDAGIMDGYSRRIGAVANVKYPKNPIELAKYVMENTDHLILGGDGADLLARKIGLEEIAKPPEYIIERYNRIKREASKYLGERFRRNIDIFNMFETGDTIGAVAIDKRGRIASAVSTGGIWLKLPGRIGDSPIPGAGFYATRKFGIASTGYGETIIENMPGIKIELMINRGITLKEAITQIFIKLKEKKIRDNMGLIGIDSEGSITYMFDTMRMMIAYRSLEEKKATLVERDD